MSRDVDVRRQFDSGAGAYDLLVRFNPGYHRNLDRAAALLVSGLSEPAADVRAGAALGAAVGDPGRPTRLVDLGCGSGASTRALLRHLGVLGSDQTTSPEATTTPGAANVGTVDVLGVDASPGMLNQARGKNWPSGVRFEVGLAQHLTRSVPAGSLDGLFACYLLRNVPPQERDDVLTGVCSSLRPGGLLVAHEYSVRGRPWAALVWTLVCWLVVIPLAVLTRGNPPLYTYLWRSVLDFDSVDDVVERMRAAGFAEVTVHPATGWSRGILHTVVARRPS